MSIHHLGLISVALTIARVFLAIPGSGSMPPEGLDFTAKRFPSTQKSHVEPPT